ncbi:MAG: alpha/beta fold hydrolase [Chitinophagales bacterium]|jgi:2-hydroxy-6-oxonona-2,4-dienedioate hydrolase|nr:alpha/beta hydrolase [Sphingobacteriales bacterium]
MPANDNYKYIDRGQGPVILVLHGLFGSLGNFESLIQLASDKYRFIMPYLPLYDCELKSANLEGMLNFLKQFISFMDLKEFSILGNSFGGHLALMYALHEPQKVKSLILTASSGLFESSLGNEYPKRDRDFLRNKILETFGNKSIVTEELVSEVEMIVHSKSSAIRIIKLAKSATRQNLMNLIHTVLQPTLLIWGKDDIITPPFVGEKFLQLMPNAELVWIDHCGHAPMMEYPKEFADAALPFLDKVYKAKI